MEKFSKVTVSLKRNRKNWNSDKLFADLFQLKTATPPTHTVKLRINRRFTAGEGANPEE